MFMRIASLIATGLLSITANAQSTKVVQNTLDYVQNTYEVKCKFQKNTIPLCISSGMDNRDIWGEPIPTWTPASNVCSFTKKYKCNGKKSKVKVKVRMSERTFWDGDLQDYRSISKIRNIKIVPRAKRSK
jgi:hypothetical protein